MRRSKAFLAMACVFAAATAATALASDFEIHLSAKCDGRQTRTQRTDESPSRKALLPRPVMQVNRNARIVASWQAENTGKNDEFQDVLMHFFVVEETRAGQPQVPKLSSGVVYEGALTMDFHSRDKAGWEYALKIPEPGNYLLRVETRGLANRHGHEYFAAMDLVVQ
jgi:hypothetical protein